MTLIGTLAAVTAPLAVSAPAWADSSVDIATAQLSQDQWKRLEDVATAHSALGVADSGAVLSLPAGTSAVDKATVEGQLPAGTHTVVQVSKFSKSKLDEIQKTVTARDWNPDADKYGVSTSYDAEADKVIVATDAPDSVTNSLRNAYPNALEVQQARFEPQATRFSDGRPFWGGVALIGTEGGTAYNCTGGFTVKERATGHLYMTTAGHCYSNLTLVHNRKGDQSFGDIVGQITRRNQNIDTELMYNSSITAYGTNMFTGGTASSGSHIFVHGTEDASLNTKVCVSGSVSFNHCGHKISDTSFSICFNGNNCIRDGKAFIYDKGGSNWPYFNNGTLTQGGDSGAPIYTTDTTGSAAFIVGSHSGIVWRSSNGCHCTEAHMVGVKVNAITQDMGVNVVSR